jgi:hypothetical protein
MIHGGGDLHFERHRDWLAIADVGEANLGDSGDLEKERRARQNNRESGAVDDLHPLVQVGYERIHVATHPK